MISTGSLKNAVTGKKVLIDTNIIIYLTDSIHPYATIAQKLFKMIEFGDAQAVISILTIGEVLQGPIRKNEYALASEVRDYLVNFPNSHYQEITFDVLECVGNDERIKWNRLRTMDSLIIASGLVNQADLIISNDKHFKSALHKDILITLDQ
jgi:predicted nucleic acid-binding protein